MSVESPKPRQCEHRFRDGSQCGKTSDTFIHINPDSHGSWHQHKDRPITKNVDESEQYYFIAYTCYDHLIERGRVRWYNCVTRFHPLDWYKQMQGYTGEGELTIVSFSLISADLYERHGDMRVSVIDCDERENH